MFLAPVNSDWHTVCSGEGHGLRFAGWVGLLLKVGAEGKKQGWEEAYQMMLVFQHSESESGGSL